MKNVFYVNYNPFGQQPSQNYNFNLLTDLTHAKQTPFFAKGIYCNYYCLLDRSMTYAKPKLR